MGGQPWRPRVRETPWAAVHIAGQPGERSAKGGQLDWSERPSGVSRDAADPSEIERLRHLLRAAGRDELARLDTPRLLGDLRLTEGSELRNAGVLVVGTEDAIRRAVPTYGYAFQHRPTAGSAATAHVREARPLLAGIERLLDAVAARASVRSLDLDGGGRLSLADFPAGAVRELVVNAFVHRSYEANGAVEVEHAPDALDVLSPGGLVPGVTERTILTHPPTPRNRLLAETVALLGVAEPAGLGIDRVYRELLRIGKAPVSVSNAGSFVRFRIGGGHGDDAFARFVAGLPEERQSDLAALTTLSWLSRRRTISPKQLADAAQRTVPEAQSTLTRLRGGDGPLVEPTPGGNTFRLTPAAQAGLGRATR